MKVNSLGKLRSSMIGRVFLFNVSTFLLYSSVGIAQTTATAPYIVTLKEGATNANLESLLAEISLSSSDMGFKFEGPVKGFSGNLTAAQLRAVRANGSVDSIDKDQEIRVQPIALNSTSKNLAPVDSQVTSWGVTRVGGSNDGTGKTVWVLDTGIDITHPDLNIDFARSKNFNPQSKDYVDGHGHGTFVAGIIGAKNNDFGVVGVAANASIAALRVFNEKGSGSLSYVMKALDHISAVGKAGDVVNISIGGAKFKNLDRSVREVAAKGIFVVIAAGNSNDDCSVYSPARVDAPGVYTISAMDNTDTMTSWSSFGSPVDFTAPGLDVRSTYLNGTYANWSGTSFATPHVAGILAVYGQVGMDGIVKGDKDNTPDPIAHRP